MPVHPGRLPANREQSVWEAIGDLRREVRQLREARSSQLQRGYVQQRTAFTVTSVIPQPVPGMNIDINVPDEGGRLLMWASAQLSTAGSGQSVLLHFTDANPGTWGFNGTVSDFLPLEFPLAVFTGGPGFFLGPAYVAPAIPKINFIGSGQIALPNGLFTGNVESGNTSLSGQAGSGYFPAPIMPYNNQNATPGLHTYYMTVRVFGGGDVGTVSDMQFWVALV